MALFGRKKALTASALRVKTVQSRSSSLVAAAARLNLADRPEAARQMRLRQGWQLNAWAYRDSIGELRYALNFLANCAARMKVFPAAYPLGGESDNPVALSELEGETVPAEVITAAAEAMKSLGNGKVALSSLMRALSTNDSVAGECFLLGKEDPETGEDHWSIRSISGIQIKDDRYYLREAPGDNQGIFGAEELDLDRDVLSRIWTPHPQWPLLADSPLRAIQEDCDTLGIIRRGWRADGRSRLAGAGILGFPNEISIKAPNADNGDPEADDFMGQLAEAMMMPLDNEGSAAAVVPIVVQGPGEHLKNITHIRLGQQFDPLAVELAEKLVGIIATALDLPKEIVTGTADLNHWSAWQVDDNTFRHHVEPHVIHCCDSLTGAFLRPYLEMEGIDPAWVDRLLLWYDPVELVTHPDQTQDAQQLYDRHAISAEALNRTAGFKPEDMPTAEETLLRMFSQMRTPPPNLVMAAVHEMFPGLTIPPITTSGTVPGVKPSGVDAGEEPLPQLGPGPAAPPPVAVDDAPPVLDDTPVEASPGPPASPVTASAATPNTGAMVALYPSPELAAQLALPDGEPPEELHITLAFLGDADSLSSPGLLHSAVEGWAKSTAPITGELSGVGLFTAGEDPVTYASPDLPSLPEAREQLIAALGTAGAEPSQEHGFTPHITLDYADRVGEVDKSIGGTEIAFDSVALVIAEDRTDYPFSQALTAAGKRQASARLSRKLVEIDRDLRTRLQTAANAAMLRQLERAGAKLRSKVAKDETLRTKISHRPNERAAAFIGEKALTAAGVSATDLLGGDWSALQQQFHRWTEAAQKRALGVAVAMGVSSDAAAQAASAQAQARDAGWAMLSGALTGLSQSLLYSPDPNTKAGDWGELNPDALVPTGTIRAALGIAGGADVASVSTAADGSLQTDGFVGQIATGDTISGLLSDAGGQTDRWQWDHAGSVQDPFEPHEDLDGVEFENFDDDVLANDGDWPDNDYYTPGDHSGCTCDAMPLWDFPGNPLNDSSQSDGGEA